ncbi:hypothetical protein [Actinoallomurus sp. CA-142502]|uniref:hypothetical protein n=1 Tax=Actinoallomurus sp. CA-142502 TaxID=3239885 RepID=UPI003D9194E8
MVSGREPVRHRTGGWSWAGPAVVAGLVLAPAGGCTTERSSVANPPKAHEAPLPTVHYSFGTQPPPWTKPLNEAGGADAAGLAMGPAAGTARRFDSHLDVFANGRPIRVAPGLGVDGRLLSEVRTRGKGILVVASSDPGKRFTLGQVFMEWGVRLEPAHLGGFTADAEHSLTAYVDGVERTGDPAMIALLPHREITLVYGAPPRRIPTSYAFPRGE